MAYTITEIPNLFKTATTPKILLPVKRILGRRLHEISSKFHRSIPVDAIEEILAIQGYHLIQEDGTPFSGIFCGDEGSCHLQFADENNNVPNHVIALQWYRLSQSSYEINCYLS